MQDVYVSQTVLQLNRICARHMAKATIICACTNSMFVRQDQTIRTTIMEVAEVSSNFEHLMRMSPTGFSDRPPFYGASMYS